MKEHRNGNEHMNLQRQQGGAIIALSTMSEDVQEVEDTAAKKLIKVGNLNVLIWELILEIRSYRIPH